MKKLTIFCALALLLSLVCIPVGAASNTYYLEELGVEMTVPQGYSVLTRNTPASDPVFSEFNLTKDYIDTLFTTSYIYLNAVTTAHREEIVVTMIPNTISDLSAMSDELLNTLKESLITEYASLGVQVSSCEVYRQGDTKFLKVYFYNSSMGSYALQFYTIFNNKAMNFTFHSYEGALTSRQENVICDLVESLRFGGQTVIPDSTEPTYLPEPSIGATEPVVVPDVDSTGAALEDTAPVEDDETKPHKADDDDEDDDDDDDDDEAETSGSGIVIMPLVLIVVGGVLLCVVIIVVILAASRKKNKKPAAPPVYPYYAPPTPPAPPAAPVTPVTPVAPVVPEVPVAPVVPETPVAPAAPVTPEPPAAPVAPAPKRCFCKHCGTPVAPGAVFCSQCGGKLTE